MNNKMQTVKQRHHTRESGKEESNSFGVILFGVFLFLLVLWMLYVAAYGARLFML